MAWMGSNASAFIVGTKTMPEDASVKGCITDPAWYDVLEADLN